MRVRTFSPFLHRQLQYLKIQQEFIFMKLKLPTGPFKAYLFDCDGTIADSMGLHYFAWKQALAEQGCEFSEELHYALGGMSVAEIIAKLNRERGLNMQVSAVEKRKEALYYEYLPQLRAVPE